MMIRKKLGSRKIWLWIVGIIVVISGIIAGVAWYFGRQWKPMLDRQLKQMVLEATDSLYSVDYSGFTLNLVSGNIHVKNFRLIPNKEVYRKLVELKKAPDNVFDLQVKELVVRNFHPKRLYSEKKLNINSIIIDNPTLFITNRRQPYNDTVRSGKPKTLYQTISTVFKEVRVNDIRFKDIDFTFENRSRKPYRKTIIKNLNVSAVDLLIDSLSETDKARFYHTRKIDLRLQEYKIATPDSLYHLVFKGSSFSTADRQFLIENMSLKPRYSRTAFYKKVGIAKDRFDLSFDNLSLRNIDLRLFAREQKLFAGSMAIRKGSVFVYNNRAYRKKGEDKTGKFPHQQLQKLALDLKIDTLRLRNVGITYAEYNPRSKRTGAINFNNTSGRFYNVTNDASSLRKNNIMTAELTTSFMNAGEMNLDFSFNLTSKRGAFAYSGSLRNMNGVAFNKITRPLGMIEIKSLWIENLKFKVTANDRVARGKTDFYYKNLSVNILKKEDESRKLKSQGLISGVANVFVIKEDNPNNKGKFTPGTVYYERSDDESFFAYLWKGLFSGVKESVGVSREREGKLRNTVEKVGSFLQKMKENREERKEERQEKRQERKKERELKKKIKEEEKEDEENVDKASEKDTTGEG